MNTLSKAYILRSWEDHSWIYTVRDNYDHTMIRTTSLQLAQQYLTLANQGITAPLLYLLESWNYHIPKYIMNQIKAPLQGY